MQRACPTTHATHGLKISRTELESGIFYLGSGLDWFCKFCSTKAQTNLIKVHSHKERKKHTHRERRGGGNSCKEKKRRWSTCPATLLPVLLSKQAKDLFNVLSVFFLIKSAPCYTFMDVSFNGKKGCYMGTIFSGRDDIGGDMNCKTFCWLNLPR